MYVYTYVCMYAVCSNPCIIIVHTYCMLVTFSIQVSMSIFQLGFVSLFLSSALVSGYTTGAAVHVATSQIRHLLDIPQANISVPPGVFNIPKVSTYMYYIYIQSIYISTYIHTYECTYVRMFVYLHILYVLYLECTFT